MGKTIKYSILSRGEWWPITVDVLRPKRASNKSTDKLGTLYSISTFCTQCIMLNA